MLRKSRRISASTDNKNIIDVVYEHENEILDALCQADKDAYHTSASIAVYITDNGEIFDQTHTGNEWNTSGYEIERFNHQYEDLGDLISGDTAYLIELFADKLGEETIYAMANSYMKEMTYSDDYTEVTSVNDLDWNDWYDLLTENFEDTYHEIYDEVVDYVCDEGLSNGYYQGILGSFIDQQEQAEKYRNY